MKFFSCIAFVLLSSCSTFREVHYFKDELEPVPNYYRLVVKGHTYFASSRYLSGYFAEEAVDDFFGEISQIEKSKFKPSENKGELNALDPSLDGKTLVLILSSNSDAIADQIGAKVESDKTLNALASIINNKNLDNKSKLNILNEQQKNWERVLVDSSEKLISQLNDDQLDENNVRAIFLNYINILSVYLGNTNPFQDIDEAKKWLDNNRVILLNSKS